MIRPADAHQERRTRTREHLAGTGVDCLLIRGLQDIRYLTGFTGSSAVLIIGPDENLDILASDGRYAEQLSEQCPDLGALIARRPLPVVLEQAAAGGAHLVGVDAECPLSTVESIARAGLMHRVVDTQITALRAIKDDAEITAIGRACEITAQALASTADAIRPGMTEIAVARLFESHVGAFGGDDRSFPTIVAAGPNSALPHHEPGDRAISEGDLIVIDCGAMVDGYHADMTRTFVLGQAQPWQLELHRVVAEAAQRARALVRAAATTASVDSAARDFIAAEGFGDRFVHGTGHGIGLDIHEAPMLGIATEGRLSANMTITVEPGVYLPGRGGIRIEDSLLVLDEGHRVLTELSRDLRSVG